MTPSFAVKKGVRYRYYVSSVLAQGRKGEAGSIARIAADAIETLVLDAINPLSCRTDDAAPGAGAIEKEADRDRVARLIDRVIAGRRSVEIRLLRHAANTSAPGGVITIGWSPAPFRRRREILQPADGSNCATRSIRIEARTKLLNAMAKGRKWLEEILSDPAASSESIVAREEMPERSVRSMISLAFLAPDLVKAAANGTLPRGFGVSRFVDLPASWTEQRQALGL